MKRNAIHSYRLEGDNPTPLRIAVVWPSAYREPRLIIVRRADRERSYVWTARREAALDAGWRAVRRGKERIGWRLDESSLEYLVSDEATAAAL